MGEILTICVKKKQEVGWKGGKTPVEHVLLWVECASVEGREYRKGAVLPSP